MDSEEVPDANMSENDENEELGYYGDDEDSPWPIRKRWAQPSVVQDYCKEIGFGIKWFGIHELLLSIADAHPSYRFTSVKASTYPIDESVPDAISTFLEFKEHQSLLNRIVNLFATAKTASIAPLLMVQVFRSVVTISTSKSVNMMQRLHQCSFSINKLFRLLRSTENISESQVEHAIPNERPSSADNNVTPPRRSPTPMGEWSAVETPVLENEDAAHDMEREDGVDISEIEDNETLDAISQESEPFDHEEIAETTADDDADEPDIPSPEYEDFADPLDDDDADEPDIPSPEYEDFADPMDDDDADELDPPSPEYEDIADPLDDGDADELDPPSPEYEDIADPLDDDDADELDPPSPEYEDIADPLDDDDDNELDPPAPENEDIADPVEDEVKNQLPLNEAAPETPEETVELRNFLFKKSLDLYNAFINRLWQNEIHNGANGNETTANDAQAYMQAMQDFRSELEKAFGTLLLQNGTIEKPLEKMAANIIKCLLKENKFIAELVLHMCHTDDSNNAVDPQMQSFVAIILDLVLYGLNDVRPVIKIIDRALRSEAMKEVLVDTSVISIVSAVTSRVDDFEQIAKSQNIELGDIQSVIFRVMDVLSLQIYLLQAILVHMVVIRARYAVQMLKQVILQLGDSVQETMKHDLNLLMQCYDFLDKIATREAIHFLEIPLVNFKRYSNWKETL